MARPGAGAKAQTGCLPDLVGVRGSAHAV